MDLPSHVDAAGKTVLIVEDEAKFANLLRLTLQARGYRCQTALNGFEALDLLRASPPDIVILDLSLPGLSGFDLLQRVRSDAPRTKILVVTGHGQEYSRLASQFGVAQILEKPVSLETFLGAVIRLAPSPAD